MDGKKKEIEIMTGRKPEQTIVCELNYADSQVIYR